MAGDATAASDIGNVVAGTSAIGLQWYNAVANNVFPTTTVATTPSGLSVISGSTGSGIYVILAIIALAIAGFLLIHH